MPIKRITKEQAIQLIADKTENCPYRVLNAAGRGLVYDWALIKAGPPQDVNAWCCEAERAANNAIGGESVIIEMRAQNAISGHPETLTIPDECFVWHVRA